MASSKKALLFIFFTLLIDVMGIGIIIPVMPDLLKGLTNGTEADASRVGGLLMFAYAIMQFICSPIMGGLSDRYGRRPVLIASLLGLGLDYLFLAWAPSVSWLFLGRLIAGVTGASFTTANAYIADISEPEKRAQNFGMVGAAFGMGFILGPLLGGILGSFGHRVPFISAAILSLINALFGFFILPESLSPENRRPFDWKRANPIGSVIRVSKYSMLIFLIGAYFMLVLAGQVHPSVWSYYTEKEFHWTSQEVGYSLAFVGLTIGFVQGYLTRIIIPKLGETKSLVLGISFTITGFVLFSFASQGWMMYAFMIPFAIGGINGPSIQSMMTHQIEANEQGEFQGTLTSLQSIAIIIGPLLATNLFAYFSEPNPIIYFPGAPFLSAAILCGFALLLVVWSFRKK